MKSSKTSDPKPSSLYRALTLPLQTHIPPSTIQQTGARRSEAVCTSLKSDSPCNDAEREEKIGEPDELPNVAWLWVVVVTVVAAPVTVVVVVVAVAVTTVVLPEAVVVVSVETAVVVV